MNPAEDYRTREYSNEDITTKFLELLLRYDYVCHQGYEDGFKLNLPDKAKSSFLKDCSEFLQLDERGASMKIKDIRNLFFKELPNLQKDLNKAKESKLSWFLLADKLFRRAFTSANATTSTAHSLEQHMASSPYSTSSFASGEKLTQKDTRSISSRDLLKETNITSKDIIYNSSKSQSLQSTSLSFQLPTTFLCSCPPITTQSEIICSKITTSNASNSPKIIHRKIQEQFHTEKLTQKDAISISSRDLLMATNITAKNIVYISPSSFDSASLTAKLSTSPVTEASSLPTASLHSSPFTSRTSPWTASLYFPPFGTLSDSETLSAPDSKILPLSDSEIPPLPDSETSSRPNFETLSLSALNSFDVSELVTFYLSDKKTVSLHNFDTLSLPNFDTLSLADFDTLSLADFDTLSLPDDFDTFSLPDFDTFSLPDLDNLPLSDQDTLSVSDQETLSVPDQENLPVPDQETSSMLRQLLETPLGQKLEPPYH